MLKKAIIRGGPISRFWNRYLTPTSRRLNVVVHPGPSTERWAEMARHFPISLITIWSLPQSSGRYYPEFLIRDHP